MDSLNKPFKRNIVLDYVHTFIRNLNFTHGIWLAYLYVEKGFSFLELGLLEGIFHIASITMEVPTGMLGDLVGRKLSRVLGLVSMMIYILIVLYGENFFIVSIGFFICGLGYTFESGSGEALVYDSLIELNEEDKYMKVQGIKEIMYQLGSSIALLIGGYIALVRYEMTYYVTLFAFVAALIPILYMKEKPLNIATKEQTFFNKMNEHFIKSTKTVLQSKRLLFLILTSSLLLAPITSLFFFAQNYLLQLDYNIAEIGIILGAHSIAGACGGYLAHKLERKYKEKLIIYFAPILLIISFWTVQINQIIFLPFILLGLIDSIIYIVLNDYINKLIPSSQRATILSFSNLSFSIIMIILFPLAGFIAELSTLRIAFIFLASVVTISYFMLILFLKKSKYLH